MSTPPADQLESHEFRDADLFGALTVDRRAANRKTIAIRATVTVPGKAVVSGRTLDLSRGGASITMPFAMESNQDCLIDLELAACGTTSVFQIPAQVRYCVRMGAARYRAGVRFGETDEATATLLAAVLRGL